MKRIVWCCLAALLTATALDAVVLHQLSNRDLVEHSDAIVIGKCTKSESKWEDRNLFTYTTIAVQETLKGESKPNVTVVVPGGVDLTGPIPIGMDYEGPEITPGEEVFLFLERIDGIPDGFSVVGYSLGKFSIRQAKDGKVVSRDLAGVTFRGETGAQATTGNGDPLAKFKQEIEQILTAPKNPDTPRKSR